MIGNYSVEGGALVFRPKYPFAPGVNYRAVFHPPGGGADLIARLIAIPMAKSLGQTVIVENRPGGSGQIAAGLVARAAPDGGTLLLDASSFAVNPSLFPKLPYDSQKDFAPLGVVAVGWPLRGAQ